jgi:hypothetical protein
MLRGLKIDPIVNYYIINPIRSSVGYLYPTAV